MIYRYKARDPSGRLIQASLNADSEEGVISYLKSMDFTPISITLQKRPALNINIKAIFKAKDTIKSGSIVIFTRQLATLTRAGIPIIGALRALAKQTDDRGLSKVVLDIEYLVAETGLSLSEAMKRHPRIFNELYVSTVYAGEQGGVLDDVLMRLAGLMEHELEIKSSVKAALRYPIMVIVTLVMAFFLLTIMVIPKFANVYAKFQSQLPLPTRIYIRLNELIRGYWHIGLVGLFFLIIGFQLFIKTEKGRLLWDSFKLKVPIIGLLLKKVAMSRFSQMFLTLHTSGLPILRTMRIISMTVGNVIVSREIDILRKSIEEGGGISGPIMESKVFPPLVGHMISIGERSGAMEDMLNAIIDHYDLEIKYAIKNLTTAIEPLLVLGLGIIVLSMALAIFLPMWNMIELFK